MLRFVFASAVVMVGVAISGCSHSPTYIDGKPIDAPSLAFDFSEPSSWAEQVVYEELSSMLAISTARNTPKLIVTTITSRGRSGSSELQRAGEASVIATVVVTLNEREVFRATRKGVAKYVQDEQSGTASTIVSYAVGRAAKVAAEALGDALLKKFPSNAAYLPF